MKNPSNLNAITPETINAALNRGRLERSRAFHAFWKSALRTIR